MRDGMRLFFVEENRTGGNVYESTRETKVRIETIPDRNYT